MIPGVFASIFAEKLKPHRIGVASQQPKNLRPMITSLDWLLELPHHFRPAKVYMYYMTWSGIWWSQVYNIVQPDIVYLCLGWWCHMSFMFFEAARRTLPGVAFRGFGLLRIPGGLLCHGGLGSSTGWNCDDPSWLSSWSFPKMMVPQNHP